MSSRRGAVKVNPVTGKMEKMTAADVPPGKHRDGCMLVDDRYVNAAKDLGLGSEKGAPLLLLNASGGRGWEGGTHVWLVFSGVHAVACLIAAAS